MAMRIVYMGTPDFAVPALERLHASDHEIVSVVTRPDSKRGRGRGLSASEIKVAAESLGLPVLQPESLKEPTLHEELRDLEPDLFVVVAFLILPRSVLKIPKRGSLNLHPSLLPRYRGAAPIQWAVINGESETGISTFLLNPRVDAGDILIQRPVSISSEETAGALYKRLKVKGADVVLETVDGFVAAPLNPTQQDDARATPAPKLTKETGRIDWTKKAETIRNLVRGTNPFPGAFTEWKNGILKVHRVSRVEGAGRPGAVLSSDTKTGLVIATGEGALRLNHVQAQGKKSLDDDIFLLGTPVDVGEQFG